MSATAKKKETPVDIFAGKNIWAYDWENFPNCDTVVFREMGTKTYKEFVIHESRNDSQELIDFLNTHPILIGFANIEYDAQITEHAHRSGAPFEPGFLWEFIQELPIVTKKGPFEVPFSEWDFSHKNIDLRKLNHYDNAARMTSLKWLGYTTRWKKLKDLPVPPGTLITKSKIPELLRYNRNDVDETYNFAYKCADQIQFRGEMARKYRQRRIMNMSDSSLGAYIFEHILTQDHGLSKKEMKKGTHYQEIYGKEVLLPYVQFQNPAFRKVHDTFKERVYRDDKGRPLTNVAGGKYEQHALFEDMVFVFGSGGIHACYSAGEFETDDDHAILSIDVASYYPNLAIANRIFPKHIGKVFCKIYEQVYKERKKYPKGNSLNYALKIALNSVYGKSNSVHSIFYDLLYLLKITVNGQLLLTMLSEALAPYGRLLMVNTDGMEIKIPRKYLAKVREICAQWELMTGLELEENLYKKVIIRDVNNYIAVDERGKVKRKGIFEMYEDITGENGGAHAYHKSPNATIIAKAWNDYYVHDIPIRETIEGCNDVFEFCYGIKGKKAFEYWLITAHDDGVIDILKRDDRVLRYYIAPEGANIYKFWKDNRKNNITGVNRGQLVKLAMNIGRPEIVQTIKGEEVIKYDVNREYYIQKAQEVIDLITARVKDKAYEKYMKKHPPIIEESELVPNLDNMN